MLGDFKVQIIERPGVIANRVYLYRVTNGKMEFITHNATVIMVKEGEPINDDELFFTDLSPDQLQAFAEALANKGVKTHKDSVAEGKLAATERHLEDMRTIALAKYATPTSSPDKEQKETA